LKSGLSKSKKKKKPKPIVKKKKQLPIEGRMHPKRKIKKKKKPNFKKSSPQKTQVNISEVRHKIEEEPEKINESGEEDENYIDMNRYPSDKSFKGKDKVPTQKSSKKNLQDVGPKIDDESPEQLEEQRMFPPMPTGMDEKKEDAVGEELKESITTSAKKNESLKLDLSRIGSVDKNSNLNSGRSKNYSKKYFSQDTMNMTEFYMSDDGFDPNQDISSILEPDEPSQITSGTGEMPSRTPEEYENQILNNSEDEKIQVRYGNDEDYKIEDDDDFDTEDMYLTGSKENIESIEPDEEPIQVDPKTLQRSESAQILEIAVEEDEFILPLKLFRCDSAINGECLVECDYIERPLPLQRCESSVFGEEITEEDSVSLNFLARCDSALTIELFIEYSSLVRPRSLHRRGNRPCKV
jgi:hypothetical protein